MTYRDRPVTEADFDEAPPIHEPDATREAAQEEAARTADATRRAMKEVTFKLTWQTRTANLEGELRGTVVNDKYAHELLADLSERGFRVVDAAQGDAPVTEADFDVALDPNADPAQVARDVAALFERQRDAREHPPIHEAHAPAANRRLLPAANRRRVLTALATMPDEAFGWFVLATAPSAMLHGANAQIWPDGIGGFTQASKDAIVEVRAAAEAYLNTQETA